MEPGIRNDYNEPELRAGIVNMHGLHKRNPMYQKILTHGEYHECITVPTKDLIVVPFWREEPCRLTLSTYISMKKHFNNTH